MRKEPPISTSSPRETMTSPFSASVLSASRTAAALLLTTMVEIAGLAPLAGTRRVYTSIYSFIEEFAEQAIDVHVALAALACF